MTTFWLNDPTILFKQSEITKLWPISSMSSSEKLNAITRLVIILTLLGYLITNTIKIIITGLVTLGAIIILFQIQKNSISKKELENEGFTNSNNYKNNLRTFQEPTINNPAMNVLLTQINDEPNRKPAAPAFNPVVENKINKDTQQFVDSNFGNDPNIKDKLFKDLGDSFTFDQSMRTWYATPNTQIPNDQKAFADFCYGDMVSCKEGNAFACSQSMPPAHQINGNN